ncbi:hypothetical protein AVEN_102903-1 [Araneus ventricosus]|uniref:Uncharacterized protein n=1 Tax=Araneus ventricosus TaxID=182803 RepID=A0A4Y2M8N8_ARAVE|nr:hypothetical protein AVEN_102903-1 [Araneus ventricosus]
MGKEQSHFDRRWRRVRGGGRWNAVRFIDLALLVRRKFAGNDELHSNTSQRELQTCLCPRKHRQDLVRRKRFEPTCEMDSKIKLARLNRVVSHENESTPFPS